MDDNGDDSGGDSFDDEFGDSKKEDDVLGGDKSMGAEADPSKLIDLELVNLIKFCNDLKLKYKDTDEHEDEIMSKGLEIGKKKKEKTLILDMDETLIAAKFEGKEPKNFQKTFSTNF